MIQKISDMWKIQLTITINFISSIDDNDEEREMHSKSDNIETIMNDKADEFIEELVESLKKRYQNKLEESMKGNKFVFDYVHLLYYKCHKINANCGGSYIHSPYWIKDKKTTINPINKIDNKCFQYAVTVALNHEEIGKNPERITEINSKFNSNREKQVILLMIPNGEDWHYLAVTKLSVLLRGIKSKNNDDFYCLNKNLNLIKMYAKIKTFVTL